MTSVAVAAVLSANAFLGSNDATHIKLYMLLRRSRCPYAFHVIWQDKLVYNSKQSKCGQVYLQSSSFLPGSGRSSAYTGTYAGQTQPQG